MSHTAIALEAMQYFDFLKGFLQTLPVCCSTGSTGKTLHGNVVLSETSKDKRLVLTGFATINTASLPQVSYKTRELTRRRQGSLFQN